MTSLNPVNYKFHSDVEQFFTFTPSQEV